MTEVACWCQNTRPPPSRDSRPECTEQCILLHTCTCVRLISQEVEDELSNTAYCSTWAAPRYVKGMMIQSSISLWFWRSADEQRRNIDLWHLLFGIVRAVSVCDSGGLQTSVLWVFFGCTYPLVLSKRNDWKPMSFRSQFSQASMSAWVTTNRISVLKVKAQSHWDFDMMSLHGKIIGFKYQYVCRINIPSITKRSQFNTDVRIDIFNWPFRQSLDHAYCTQRPKEFLS